MIIFFCETCGPTDAEKLEVLATTIGSKTGDIHDVEFKWVCSRCNQTRCSSVASPITYLSFRKVVKEG